MTQDQTLLLAVGGLSVVCLGLVVAVVRLRTGAQRAGAVLASLRVRVDELESDIAARVAGGEVASPAAGPVEFVITDLGRPETPAEPVRLDAPAFADVVLRETVVKAASLVHGVRRGLAPETRNRIRFEMRQEVRRSRRQRRADLKSAQRDRHARQRADLAEEASSW